MPVFCVPWPGNPLTSRQRIVWRVKVWTDGRESDWSSSAWFETGLLDAADWTARFIEPVETERSAHLLRHTFELGVPPAQARLYATAHGIYETFLNGRRVGDVELAPGFTSYPTTLHVQAYDVGALLVRGHNVWEVVLSDGWWRGRVGFFQSVDGFGSTLAFLGQLHADEIVVATGGDWESSKGALLAADLMAGQFEDHRTRPEAWQPVTVTHHDLGSLAYSPAPPTRRVQELRPVAVTRPSPDRQVVDLGQNINGWLRLSDVGQRDTELTIVYGEALDPSGDVTQDHLSPDLFGNGMQVGMVDRVVADGSPGEVFEPRHTTHGFQYAAHRGPLRPTHARRRHRRGRPHGPEAHGLVPLQRRSAQPAARHHGVVVPRQRLRDPNRLSPARAGRLDRRLAVVRADRGLPLRRRGLLRQMAAGRGGGTARRWADHQLRAGPATATGGEYGAMAADAGVVRLG